MATASQMPVICNDFAFGLQIFCRSGTDCICRFFWPNLSVITSGMVYRQLGNTFNIVSFVAKVIGMLFNERFIVFSSNPKYSLNPSFRILARYLDHFSAIDPKN